MKHCVCICLVILAFGQSQLVMADDDWFNVQKGYYLAASLGAFDDGSLAKNLAFRAPLNWGLEFNSQYSALNGDADSGDGFLLSIQTDSAQTLSVGAGYESYQSDSGFELQSISFNASLSLGEWESQLRIGESELRFAIEGSGIAPIIRDRIEQLGLLDADRRRIGFSLGYFDERWGLRLNLDDYDLDRSRPSADFNQETLFNGLSLEERRQLIESLNTISDERPIIELYRSLWVSNYAVNEQVNISADFSTGLDFYFWDASANTYSLGLMYVEQVGSGSSYIQGLAAAEFFLSDNTTMGLLISSETDQSTVYGELTLGFSW